MFIVVDYTEIQHSSRGMKTQMARHRRRLLIIHNEMAPYRLDLFNELATAFDLTVLFCYWRGKERFWTGKQPLAFRAEVLRNYCVSFKGYSVHWNPGVLRRVVCGKYDSLVFSYSYHIGPSLLTAYLGTKLDHKSFILWLPDTRYRLFEPGTVVECLADKANMYLKRFLVSRASAFIAYGTQTREHLSADLGVSEERVFAGTQVVPRRSLQQTKDFSRGLVFIYLGYLNRRKGVADLIDAFKRVPGRDCRLFVVGDGPEAESLQVSAVGDSRIEFLGYREGADKEEILARAHVCIAPSHFDNMPNALLECMSYGMPVIATKECHCPEWLNDNALVYDAGDRATLQKHIEYLVHNRFALQKMSDKSIHISNRYDLSYAVSAFNQAIQFASLID